MSSASQRAVDARRRAVEHALRIAAGLEPEQPLHPPGAMSAEVFSKQAAAVDRRRSLIEEGTYSKSQVGIFSREIANDGVRNYLVDTYAGFALDQAPENDPFGSLARPEDKEPPHLYEVFLEDQPCWWYFDLEYSRESNPELDLKVVAAAFWEILASFCREKLGAALDEDAVLELESSTPTKFSKHVVLKKLRAAAASESGEGAAEGGEGQNLAFANNAQVGLLVTELVAYAQLKRQDPGSGAGYLFVKPPPSQQQASSQPGCYTGPQEVCIIDESVYSRNRCFRLPYSSKFGKTAALRPVERSTGQRREPPAQRMLAAMASFVLEGVTTFLHPLIPVDYGHQARLCSRALQVGGGQRSRVVVGTAGKLNEELMKYLIGTWDGVRRQYETPTRQAYGHTSIQSCVEVGSEGRFLCVTIRNNRFCFCKGESHKAHSVYLVLDLEKCVFHQKCHDRADCGSWYRSPPFDVSPALCGHDPEAEEEAEEEGAAKRARVDDAGNQQP